ncbi:hypothetical protein ACO2Q8_26395 [Larkinella sp. VNQ87]|uniref:hypothetical protein n=1 Tax=Larkinella sp. VNQ87 TaxID=3400921 RepID=UPI003C0521AB
MIFDTNLILRHIRTRTLLPVRTIIPIIVAGELEALALRNDWGYQKVKFLQHLLDTYPTAEPNRAVARLYGEVEAYSQGRFSSHPLPPGISARNMGKNDLWIAVLGLYLDMEVHTSDHDFDHLPTFGLKLVKHPV